MNKASKNHRGERGGAGAKLLIVLTVLILIGNAGINYIPVAYEGQDFKQEMQTAVVQGLALPSNGAKPADAVKARIVKAAKANDLPIDAFIDVRQVNNVIQARVYYTKPIVILPLGIYTYNYEFDHTATPTGFMVKSVNQ
ncbi:MAG TPA: hypothetical protein VF692_03195 [Pyrinomonadaceae bacterium]|jgi:hypothetical protein